MPVKTSLRIIVVDTNCFVRLFMSDLRPLLGVDLGGVKLLTLAELAGETMFGSNVAARHPWIGGAAIQQELKNATLVLKQPKRGKVETHLKVVRLAGNKLLSAHCKKNGLAVLRELSLNDAKAFAAADVLDAPLATDEWPLRLVAQSMGYDEPGLLLTSLEVLHMLEAKGWLIREQRIKTVRAWIHSQEPLPKDWKAQYKQLFGDDPPDGQGAN